MKMSAQGYQVIYNKQRGNHYTTGQTAAGPIQSLYTGTAKEWPIFNKIIKGENKTSHTETRNSLPWTDAKKMRRN